MKAKYEICHRKCITLQNRSAIKTIKKINRLSALYLQFLQLTVRINAFNHHTTILHNLHNSNRKNTRCSPNKFFAFQSVLVYIYQQQQQRRIWATLCLQPCLYHKRPLVNYVLSTWLNITFHTAFLSRRRSIFSVDRHTHIFAPHQHSPSNRFERTMQSTKQRQRQTLLCQELWVGVEWVAIRWQMYIVFPFNFPFSHVQKALLW